jgi:hypothetical protein
MTYVTWYSKLGKTLRSQLRRKHLKKHGFFGDFSQIFQGNLVCRPWTLPWTVPLSAFSYALQNWIGGIVIATGIDSPKPDFPTLGLCPPGVLASVHASDLS